MWVLRYVFSGSNACAGGFIDIILSSAYKFLPSFGNSVKHVYVLATVYYGSQFLCRPSIFIIPFLASWYAWNVGRIFLDQNMQLLEEVDLGVTFNTLPSAHAEIRDCLPMRCWRAPHFCVFFTRRPTHAFSSWSDTLIASRLSSATCRMFGSQVTSRQTALEPYFRTISVQNIMGLNIKSV